MKENSLSGEDVKTPPPLTPKDSLSVEVEEIAKRLNKELVGRTLHDTIVVDLARLLSIVDDLMKDLQKEGRASYHYFEELTEARCNHALLEAKLLEEISDLRNKMGQGQTRFDHLIRFNNELIDLKIRLNADLATAQAQLRRKDEALEKICDLEKGLKHPSDCIAHATDDKACDCGKGMIGYLTRDALKQVKENEL